MKSSFSDNTSRVSLIFLRRRRFGYLLSSFKLSLRLSSSSSDFHIPAFLRRLKKSAEFSIYRDSFFLFSLFTSYINITSLKNSSADYSASIKHISNSNMVKRDSWEKLSRFTAVFLDFLLAFNTSGEDSSKLFAFEVGY